MKDIYQLSNSEKKRIIEMHQNSTKRHYLFESTSAIINYGDDDNAVCDIICNRKVAKYGSNGEFVKRLQHAFINNGFGEQFQGGGMYKGCKTDYKKCDGLFRDKTEGAVEEFQKKYGLPQNGIVDSTTLNKICDVLNLNTDTTYGQGKGINWKMLCNKFCDCENQETDDMTDDDLAGYPIGGGDDLIWQGEISTNCERLWNCFIEHLWTKREGTSGRGTEDLKGFYACVAGKKTTEKKSSEWTCEDCKKEYPTGYINRMPSYGKQIDRNTEFENYCIKNCGIKVAV